MRIKFFVIVVLMMFSGNAQTEQDSVFTDARYLEDQFYLGVTYNFILGKPSEVSQRNLSYGLQAGFIKDMPLNESRTLAFGAGLGYGVYSYYTNLKADKTETGFIYRIPDDSELLKRNKIETHMIEIPLEFRWRTSTASSYKFYRIYTGVKLAYVVGARSKAVFDTYFDTYKDSFYNSDVSNFQYGFTFNFGYSTFNLHVYYALNNLFGAAKTQAGETINFRPLRVGFIFYIL